MTMTTAPDLLVALRGDRACRPGVDRSLAGGLRAWLEDDLAPLVAEVDLGQPISITPRSAASPPLVAVPDLRSLSRAALLGALVTHRVVLSGVEHPMDDALCALEADPGRREIVEAIHLLEPDAFAKLAAELTAHHTVLATHLGPIPPTWLPRTHVRLTCSLAGGRVILSAVPSLVLGPPASRVATVSILDVTTSILEPTAVSRLGVLALLELLRSGAAPLRVASLSTATGERLVLDVDDDLLTGAVGTLVNAVRLRSIVS